MKAIAPKSIVVSLICLFASSPAVSLQEEPLSPKELAAEIAKYGEKVEASKWKPHWNEFWKDLKKLKKAGAHGTRGDVLESILENSLGAPKFLPKSSTDPKHVWFTPFPASGPIVGLYGAYPFALRGITAKNQLKVVDESDTIDRYVREFEKAHPYFTTKGVTDEQKKALLMFLERTLRVSGEKYVAKRGKGQSFPVILIYDVKGFDITKGKFFEFATTKPVAKDHLRFVWVPAEDFSKAQGLLKKHKADKAIVLPLELIELYEKTQQ